MMVCKTCEEGDLERVFLDRDGVLSSLSGGPGMWAHAYEDSWWPCTKEAAYAIEGQYYCVECSSELFASGEVWGHSPIVPGDFLAEPVPCSRCVRKDVFDRKTHTILVLSDESWLISWPTEPGSYWFHGWPNGDDGSLPRTFLVELTRVYSGNIITSSSRLVGLTEGVVISRSIACGVWHPRPVELPVPPQTPKGEA